jgi:hypothetical protein
MRKDKGTDVKRKRIETLKQFNYMRTRDSNPGLREYGITKFEKISPAK